MPNPYVAQSAKAESVRIQVKETTSAKGILPKLRVCYQCTGDAVPANGAMAPTDVDPPQRDRVALVSNCQEFWVMGCPRFPSGEWNSVGTGLAECHDIRKKCGWSSLREHSHSLGS